MQRIFVFPRELRAVCMYDRRLFDPQVVAGVLHAHPVGISLGEAAATVACRRMTISETEVRGQRRPHELPQTRRRHLLARSVDRRVVGCRAGLAEVVRLDVEAVHGLASRAGVRQFPVGAARPATAG